MPLRDEDLPRGIVRSRPKGEPPRAEAPLPPRSRPHERGEEEIATERAGNGASENRITALEPQQKREGRVNVFIDGKFALGLFDEVVLGLGLRIGQQITPERLEEIAAAETLRRALEDAYNLLSFRSRAEKELADRLARKGYDPSVIVQVTEKLRAAGYLDDEAFAQSWVEGRGRTRGKRALAHELRQKGVDSETVARTLAETKTEEAEQESARLAAVRKVGERPSDGSREAQAKLAAFLQRRGFGWDIIRPVLVALYAVRDDDTDEAGDGDFDEEISSDQSGRNPV